MMKRGITLCSRNPGTATFELVRIDARVDARMLTPEPFRSRRQVYQQVAALASRKLTLGGTGCHPHFRSMDAIGEAYSSGADQNKRTSPPSRSV